MYREPMPAMQGLLEIQKQFSEGKRASLLVTGTSMVPFLRHKKDWVLLQMVSEEPKVGQILLFSMGERLLLHRLIRKKDGCYIMNGDGQAKLEVIRPEQVEAVVCGVVRQSGRSYDCDSPLWRLLWLMWRPTRPFRKGILKVAAALKSMVRGSIKDGGGR